MGIKSGTILLGLPAQEECSVGRLCLSLHFLTVRASSANPARPGQEAPEMLASAFRRTVNLV